MPSALTRSTYQRSGWRFSRISGESSPRYGESHIATFAPPLTDQFRQSTRLISRIGSGVSVKGALNGRSDFQARLERRQQPRGEHRQAELGPARDPAQLEAFRASSAAGQ